MQKQLREYRQKTFVTFSRLWPLMEWESLVKPIDKENSRRTYFFGIMLEKVTKSYKK